MTENNDGRRVIQLSRPIAAPTAARPKALRSKRIADFRGVPKVYLEVAQKLSNPLLMGPPLCDELVAFVRHVFTEEEAALVRHLGFLRGSSAAQLARAEHRPLEQIEPILHGVAIAKRAIAAAGEAENTRYRLMPVMPGIFEMVLIGQSPESLSPWHQRFAELFESLYESGYTSQYQQGQTRVTPLVRVLSVGQVIDAHPAALPSDRLEAVLDRFEVFGIGQCGCRITMQAHGRGCGRPLGNCAIMGEWAQRGIQGGWLKQVPRREVLAIKREAESHGLATWIINVESAKGQVSCSCCGCCCHAMRIVSDFNAPGVMAPAHFLPQFDDSKCTFCGKCARKCPMGALQVDLARRSRKHLGQRCIGCGLCAVACGDLRAIAMQPVPDYRLPYKSWFSLLSHTAPGMLQNAWKVWKSR